MISEELNDLISLEVNFREPYRPSRCLLYRMKISYRVPSIAIVPVVVGMIVVPGSLMVRPPTPTTRVLEDGAVSFDPCSAWEQIGFLTKLSALVWIGTFLPLFIQGLRNRTLPRVVAVVSLIAFALSLRDQLWRVQHCDSHVGIAVFAVWVSTVGLLCLHHIFQRPVRA